MLHEHLSNYCTQMYMNHRNYLFALSLNNCYRSIVLISINTSILTSPDVCKKKKKSEQMDVTCTCVIYWFVECNSIQVLHNIDLY
jgi:hypothetical protein